MKVLSLFDGISCARVALQRSGLRVSEYYASEIDRPAMGIAAKNFARTIQIGDVHTDVLPEGIDLLIGGSPCQDLSIANNKRKGLSGKRSSLFWEYVRILHMTRPKYFVLENVASMPKEVRALITKTLGVEPIMIDAALVSGQRRKRLFWTNIPNVQQPADRGILLKHILEKQVDEKYFISDEALKSLSSDSQSGRVYGTEGKSVTLQAGGGGAGAKTGLYLIIPEATKQGYAIAREGDAIDLSFPNSKTRRGRVGNKVKTLVTSGRIHVFTGGRVRRLTPIECERLQCLPDNYTFGVSDAQRYKMLGNAFNVEVVSHILSFIKQ